MMASAMLAIFYSGLPVMIVAERILGGLNSFTLLAVPFFILAAVIMNRAGVTEALLAVARCFVGHFRGGTAQVDMLASILFAGMSGSATADAASQGRMLIPAMEREGYDLRFAAAVTAASSTVGAIIPPSIAMIIYGSITSISIGALFLGGLVPGLLIGLAMMVVVAVVSRRRRYPSKSYVPWRDRWPTIRYGLPALLAPVVILGGIVTGVTTATEAGVIACIYSLLLGLFVYREITLRDLMPLLAESVEATAVPVFIIAAAVLFGFVLTINGFGFMVEELLLGVTESPLVFMMIVLCLFLLVGLFVEGTAAMLIFVPIFAPVIDSYGIDPIHFALVVIVTIMIGTITPPVGLQLFVTANIARVPLMSVMIWPFVTIMILVVLFMIIFPQTVTLLPSVVMS
jgi:C4-dicarboxylate transporter DctM subunit